MANEKDGEGVKTGCQDEGKVGGCCGGSCNAPVEGVAASEKAKDLKTAVAETLAASGPDVFNAVKEHLVKEEIAKRTELVLKGLAKKDELEREAKKIKPDPKTATYDADGKVVTPASYTEDQVKTIKANREQLNKLEKALELALNAVKPDFSKLREIVGK